jgi:hypothetical protein
MDPAPVEFNQRLSEMLNQRENLSGVCTGSLFLAAVIVWARAAG